MVTNLAHFIWISDTNIPAEYRDCLQSFYRLHPGWKVNIWFWKDVEPLIRNSKYDFNKHTSFINRYNFIKYHILASQGGWFVDLDIRWKKSLDQLMYDKCGKDTYPDLFVPVRTLPRQKEIDLKCNDDMLIFSKPGLFHELLEHCFNRTDYDISKKYEPLGPVSLSGWLHSTNYSREYLYEWEIQENGSYCIHANRNSWKYF